MITHSPRTQSLLRYFLYVSICTFLLNPVTLWAANEKSEPAPASPTAPKPYGLWNLQLNKPNSNFRVAAHAEIGFLAVLSNKIQFGKNGAMFDYVRDGSQDVLFRFLRLSMDVTLFKRHTLTLLFQPLDARSQSVLREDLPQDMASFKKGESMDLRYGFDFYRLSYTYDFLQGPEREFSIGLSLQIRNAAIVFTSLTSDKRSYRNDVGLVPILKMRGRFPLKYGIWFGFEADGFYAPISYLNGSDTNVVGAILDASVRVGKRVTPFMDLFLNIRYVGGGGSGQSDPEEPFSDGYVDNFLHLLSLSIGISLR